MKAPDSKLFLPLWTDFLPLGQKCHFRPISLGFYNSHLDREGHRKTRFSTSSIQAEYTSGSIQVGGKQSDTGRLGFPVKIRLLCGAARRSTGHCHSAKSLPPLRCSACHQTGSCGGSIAIRPGGSYETVPARPENSNGTALRHPWNSIGSRQQCRGRSHLKGLNDR